jgi:hypothetical protein
MSNAEIDDEFYRLKSAIGKKWKLSEAQFDSLASAFWRLSAQARNECLQEFFTQAFWPDEEVIQQFPSPQDNHLMWQTVMTWMLSEIVQWEQNLVNHVRNMLWGCSTIQRMAIFSRYIDHPYVRDHKITLIWPWIARLVAFIPDPDLILPAKVFACQVHKRYLWHCKDSVSKASNVLLFIWKYAIECTRVSDFKNWEDSPLHIEIGAALDERMKHETTKREKSPKRKNKR